MRVRLPGPRGREQTAIRVRTQGGQRSAGAVPWPQGKVASTDLKEAVLAFLSSAVAAQACEDP